MLNQGIKAIRGCEARLRELMAEASTSGHYEVVSTLTDWAKTLASLLDSLPSQAAHSKQVDIPPTRVETSRETKVASRISRSKKGKSNRPQYPCFSRYRDDLIKTGWSKKDKKEYQHRAPRPVADLLRMKLEHFKGKDITSDELLPLIADGGHEIPSYQAYLCLAWFRETGMIIKNGRQGYFVDNQTNLKTSVDQHWQLLPQQR